MIAGGGIIIWTAILFIAVASKGSALHGWKGAVCNVTVDEPRTRYVWNGKDCDGKTPWLNRNCSLVEENYSVPVKKKKCCKGYVNESSICLPRCSLKCKNSNCAKPKECFCSPGSDVKICDSSLWCVVKVNSTTQTSNRSVETWAELTLIGWKGPLCRPECRDQATNLFVSAAESEKMTYYALPIKSDCNNGEDFWNRVEALKYPLGVSLGIISLAIIVFCIMCIMRRKRRAACHVNDIPMKPGIDQEFMVENTIYA